MTTVNIRNLHTTIGELLKTTGPEGALLESKGKLRLAVMPLDDDVLDFLMERSPKLIKECAQIRERVKAGDFYTLEEAQRMFASDQHKTGRSTVRRVRGHKQRKR